MRKVKNTKVISRLSTKILQAKKKKNFIAVMAIALTSVLFTALFTIGGNMLHTNQENTFIQVGTRSHAGFKQFTQKEYDILSKDKKIRDLSYNIFVGFTTNQELNKIQGEVRYFQEQNAKDGFSYPTTGNLPEKEDEMACSTIILDALGIPHELGQPVTLDMQIHGEPMTKTFTLSGYWKGNETAQAQEIAVSRTYSDKAAPLETTCFYDAEDQTDMSGYINASFNFSSGWNIEGQMDALCERCGFDQTKVKAGVNWAYGTATVDATTILLIVVMLLLILLSGYLIIYNVFYLNIFSDIRSYGLLKTIGTTGKQLKKLVHLQATRLCIIGIPIGLILGWVLGRCLTPVIMSMLTMGDIRYSVNPLIFVGAAAFSWVTVRISCLKPCRIAAKVSPVEAVRYTEGQSKRKKQVRKTRKNTMFSMARANMGRNIRKSVLVIVSCALSMMILNSVYTIVTGFDMDKYLSNYVKTDFSVTDATISAYTGRSTVLDGVTKEFQEELAGAKGVTDIGNIYETGVTKPVSEKEWQTIDRISKDEKNAGYWDSEWIAEMIAEIEKNRVMGVDTYGVDQNAFDMVDVYDGDISWEKFQSGDYVIVNAVNHEEDSDVYSDSFDEIGDKVTLDFGNGKTKEYEVLAIGEMYYAAGSRMRRNLGIEYILPQQEIFNMAGERQPLRTIFNAKKEEIPNLEKWLEQYTQKVNPDLAYESKAVYVKQFDNVRRVYLITGGFLSFILGLIGILNFVNVMVTSIYSRRQELAMMESIGMTGGQQKRMLQYEGLIYGLASIGIACTAGVAIGYGIVQLIAGQMWIFTWHFTLLPIAICAPILLILSFIIPLICYWKICAATSVVERLRVAE
ncbi:MAG: ABC transporter permease [Hespellia sp.]|nr:ABC transporter permease [Hespellia sp.]